jgi:hypothetical protein
MISLHALPQDELGDDSMGMYLSAGMGFEKVEWYNGFVCVCVWEE